MKKIILIIGKRPLKSLGGLEVHCSFIANYFKNIGYNVEYFSTQDQFKLIEKIYGASYISIFLSCLIIRIKFLFKINKYDIIFTQEYTGAFFPKSKKIFNFHHICQSALDQACGLKAITLGDKLLIYQKEILEYLATHNKNILTVSNRVGKELEKHNANSIQVINNCIPDNSFLFNNIKREEYRKKLDIKSNENVIMFAGRSDLSWKGVDLLKNIINSEWSKEYIWVILSDENIDIKSSKNIRVLKNVPHEDMSMYYQVADSALFLSRYEGDSYYLIEALAAGLNVCAFDAGTSFQLLSQCKLDDMYLGNRTNNLTTDANKIQTNLKIFFAQSEIKKLASRHSISRAIQTVRSVKSWEKSLKLACGV